MKSNVYIYIYIYIDICIYVYTFMYIPACVWIHHKAFDYGSLQNTLGFHVWKANCDGLREELDAVRFRRLLEDPRGGSLQAFGQAPFQHTKLLQQLLFRLAGGFLQAELAGKTVRAMEGVGSTGRFVFAFLHGQKC